MVNSIKSRLIPSQNIPKLLKVLFVVVGFLVLLDFHVCSSIYSKSIDLFIVHS